MKITGENMNTISESLQNQGVFDTSKAAGPTERSTVSEVPTDQIDVGGQTGLLFQAQSAGSAESNARNAQLQQLVQSGQYVVDNGALSSSLVTAALNGD
jgi:anti-sigma28 factor (negative regulator of flagellin synthesis)